VIDLILVFYFWRNHFSYMPHIVNVVETVVSGFGVELPTVDEELENKTERLVATDTLMFLLSVGGLDAEDC
jgi:hypothetical protein